MAGEEQFHPAGVVVGDDGSANAAAAVRYAAGDATRRGLTLHIVAAYSLLSAPHPPDLPFGYVPSDAELGEAVEQQLAERWSGLSAPSVELHAVRARAADTLVRAGETAALVVVGARGVGGFDALLLGSVADQVARHCACPVTVVKA